MTGAHLLILGRNPAAESLKIIGDGSGVFAAHKDPAFFAQVSVDPEAGTVVWPNDTDLDPDVLYEAAHGLHTLRVDDRPE